MKKALALILAAMLALTLFAGCGGGSSSGTSSSGSTGGGSSAASGGTGGAPEGVPTIDKITLSTKDKPGDYADLSASIKILTDRTDIVDTVYAEYVKQFNEVYPNIQEEYEAVSDYENSLKLRMTTGD